MTPEDLAKAMGIQYTPGMSYDDFRAQVAAKQGGIGGPIMGPTIPPALPPPPTDIKSLAQATQGHPTGVKPIALEGVPAVLPGGPVKPPKDVAPPKDEPGIDYSALLKPTPGVTIGAHLGKTASDEQSARLMSHMDQEAQAAQDVAKAQANTQSVTAQENAGLARIRASHAQQIAVQEAPRQHMLDQHIEQQNQMMNDIRSSKIDPDHYFNKDGAVVGSFRKIAAMMATAIGGYAAGLRGGQNMAQAIIDKNIDRDIDAQRAEIEKKRGLLSDSRNLFAQKLQQFGDQRAAEMAVRSDMYGAAQALAESHIADAKTDEQKAQAKAMAAQYAQKKDEVDMKLHPYIQAQTVGGISPMQKVQMMEAIQRLESGKAAIGKTRAETAKLEAEAANGGGKGQKGLPPSVISQLGSVQSARQAIDAELKLMDNKTISDADRRRLSGANLSMLSLELPKAFTGGVPTKEEVEETKANLPPQQGGLTGALNTINPFGASDETKKAQLLAQRKMLEHKEAALRATANEARAVGSSGPEDQ